MIIQQLKMDFRRLLPRFLQFFLLSIGFVLLYNDPLGNDMGLVIFVSVIQGMVFASAIFLDKNKISAFVFSRAISRKQLFLIRWILGISAQLAILITVFAILASGMRWHFHLGDMMSAFYPMIQFYELRILWPMAVFSLLGYQIRMFFILRHGILECSHIKKSIIETASVFVCGFTIVWLLSTVNAGVQMSVNALLAWPGWVFILGYVLLVSVLTTRSAIHCYEHIEIDA